MVSGSMFAALAARWLRLSLLASGALMLVGNASALERTFNIGGNGGAYFNADCGVERVLAGLDVRAGAALDSLTPLCVDVTANGRWSGAPVRSDATAGSGDGDALRLVCPRDQAVSGHVGSAGSGNFASSAGAVQLRCQPLISRTDVAGEITLTALAGAIPGGPSVARCNGNKAARGVFGKAGDLIDQYGLLCNSRVPAPEQAQGGAWSELIDWPMIPIHAVLTPQGQVLSFGTDERGVQGAQYFYDVWDPAAGTGPASHETLENSLNVDSFCSAPLVLPEDGRVLMPGGDARYGSGRNKGITDAPVFDPDTRRLSRAADMQFARWYPTATTLANGEILLAGGIDGAGNPSITPEIYSTTDDQWRSLFGATSDEVFGPLESRWWYPRQWVAPDERVFGMAGSVMYYLDTAGNGSIERVGTVPSVARNYRSTAVMYQPGKILQVGGEGNEGAIVVDINGSSPETRQTSSMLFNRNSWATSTVLPDGQVLVTGGSSADNSLGESVTTAELWNPQDERWTPLADAELPRLYHSSALLLPDGRVLVGGGGAPGPLINTNVEIYSPPYLFADDGGTAARLEIVRAENNARVGDELTIEHSANATVSRVTLIKTGAVTHSSNMDQRFVELPFDVDNGRVTARLPGSSNVTPPGYYMLFLLDESGTPSPGHLVKLGTNSDVGPDPDPELDPEPEPEPGPGPDPDPSAKLLRRDTPAIGGSGGVAFAADCGANHALVGARVQAESALSGIGALCARVDSDGTWLWGPFLAGGIQGDQSGSTSDLVCPADHAVTGATGSRSAVPNEAAAGYIELTCTALITPVSVVGAQVATESAGLEQDASSVTVDCPPGRPARGLIGRAERVVDNYALLCLGGPDS